MARVSLTKIRKGFAMRKPVAEVKRAALRMRRRRDLLQQAKLMAAGIVVPDALLNIRLGRNGRPRLSDDEILLPVHAAALRWRIYQAGRRVQAQQTEVAEPLALLAAVAESEVATAAEVQAATALRKLARSLDARNSTDGLVADGPCAARLSAAIVRSVECCIGGSDELCAEAYPMRCCGQGMCKPCLRAWLRRNGERQDMGYGDGASSAPVGGDAPKGARANARRDGRRYTKKVQTHHCPFCRQKVESVRRGLVICE